MPGPGRWKPAPPPPRRQLAETAPPAAGGNNIFSGEVAELLAGQAELLAERQGLRTELQRWRWRGPRR